MKKYVLLCGFSALLGGLLSTAFKTHSVEPRAWAQDAPTRGLRPTFEDEFTAAEQVNIAVYDHVNRSVVNITTLQLVVAGSSAISLVASMPSITGMRTSINTTSG